MNKADKESVGRILSTEEACYEFTYNKYTK